MKGRASAQRTILVDGEPLPELLDEAMIRAVVHGFYADVRRDPLIGPIFTGGAVTAQVRQAEGAQQAALAGYEKTVQGAFADVENALIAQQKTRERLTAQQGLVDALRDYARLARLQFDGGYAPYSTVLQAEQTLFPAELTLAQDRAQVFSATVSVYQSLGGGWVTLADGMTRVSTVTEAPAAAR